MPAHPKPTPKAKKPGAMRTKPKPSKIVDGLKEAVAGKATVKVMAVAEKPGQTKGALILAMLKPPGATSKALEAATGWKPHSVRGYLGMLRKSGVNVISTKAPKEATIYHIGPPPESAGEVL